jgi:hypothetical protein
MYLPSYHHSGAPVINYSVNPSYSPRFVQKIFHSQCYLVATVIHIQSLHSQICVHIHMFFTTERRWSDKRNKKKIGTAVNAACHGNLSSCYFGHLCHRFAPLLKDNWRWYVILQLCSPRLFRAGSVRVLLNTAVLIIMDM